MSMDSLQHMIDFPDRFLVLACPMRAGAAEKTTQQGRTVTPATKGRSHYGTADDATSREVPPWGRIGVMNWWSGPSRPDFHDAHWIHG